MSTVLLVWAWIGLAAGVLVLGVVQLLLNRVLRPLREIKRYADDVLAAGLGITRHLDGIDEAVQTRELALALPGLVRARFGEPGEVEWSA